MTPVLRLVSRRTGIHFRVLLCSPSDPLPVDQLECCGKPGQSIGGGRRSYHQMRKKRGETIVRVPPSPSSVPSYARLLRGKHNCLPLGSRSLHFESWSRKGFWGQPSSDGPFHQHWLAPLWCGRRGVRRRCQHPRLPSQVLPWAPD